MKKIPTQIDNPKGLHQRYSVKKLVKKTYAPGSLLENEYMVEEEPDPDAEYFVLRLDEGGKDREHIKACRIGVHAYADAIQHHLPELAKDLKERYPLLPHYLNTMPTKKQLGQMIEAENEYPGIRRDDDPAKVQPIDPELISITHSEGELPVDGLLDAMERGEKKERCPYKLFIIKYFGLPEDVSFNKVPKVCYADLVSILCMYTEEKEHAKPVERTFTLAEALEIAKYFEDRGMDIMSKAEWGEFTKTMDVNTYMKEKFNIDLLTQTKNF